MADTKEESPSMEDILNTIRGVIAGEDEKTTLDDESKQPEPAEKTPEAVEASQPEVKAEPAAAKPAEKAPEAQPAVVEEETPDSEDDILELTELVETEDDQVAEQEKQPDNFLDDIDSMLEENQEAPAVPEPEAAPAGQEDAMVEAAPAPAAEEAPAPAPEPEPEAAPPSAEPAQEAPAEAPAPSAEGMKERLISDTAAASSQAVLKEMMASVPRARVESPATRGGTTLEDLVIEAIRPYLSEWMDKNLATIVKQLVEKEIKHLIPRDSE